MSEIICSALSSTMSTETTPLWRVGIVCFASLAGLGAGLMPAAAARAARFLSSAALSAAFLVSAALALALDLEAPPLARLLLITLAQMIVRQMQQKTEHAMMM
eukprot:Amastigsp_a294_248.p3 type:complete len:103 gc:universal Amastigsp_a294_248:664-356(-)